MLYATPISSFSDVVILVCRMRYTFELAYANIGWCDTSSVVSDILHY